MVKAPACNVGELGLIPGSGRCPGDGNSKPRQFSSTLSWKIPWMEEPHRLLSMGVAKSGTWLSDFTFTFTRGWQTLSLEDLKSIYILGLCRPHNISVALFLLFFFKRITQQNKIPIYCWTTLFHTHIKQAKKIESNFRDKKKKKKNPFIFGLSSHLRQNQLLIVQLSTYTKCSE